MTTVPKKELTKYALEIVAALRGQTAGVINVRELKGWTKEELERTADLILKDLRENCPETLEMLQKLYEETGGTPFKEIHYGD